MARSLKPLSTRAAMNFSVGIPAKIPLNFPNGANRRKALPQDRKNAQRRNLPQPGPLAESGRHHALAQVVIASAER